MVVFSNMAASMRLLSSRNLVLNSRLIAPALLFNSHSVKVQPCAGYAKKVGGAGKVGVGAVPERKRLQPELDAAKLVSTLSGGNIYKEGSDPVLKPRQEYPEWLWTLRTERKPRELDELEFDTQEYWRRIVKQNRKMDLLRMKNKYRFKRF